MPVKIAEHAPAPVAGAGGANGDVDCCSSGVARPGVVHSVDSTAGLSVSSTIGTANARGRWGGANPNRNPTPRWGAAAVAGKRTRGVDIGDGDRGPWRAAVAAASSPAAVPEAAAAAVVTAAAAVLGSVALVTAAVFVVEHRSLSIADCTCSAGRQWDPANTAHRLTVT